MGPPPAAGRAPWRKILYEAQDYADNYVDASFLDKLQRNRELCASDCE
jgi:phosphatidylinositol glycan class C protein